MSIDLCSPVSNTFSLKNPENGYWYFVSQFTHTEVKKDIDENPDVHSVFDKGKDAHKVQYSNIGKHFRLSGHAYLPSSVFILSFSLFFFLSLLPFYLPFLLSFLPFLFSIPSFKSTTFKCVLSNVISARSSSYI